MIIWQVNYKPDGNHNLFIIAPDINASGINVRGRPVVDLYTAKKMKNILTFHMELIK